MEQNLDAIMKQIIVSKNYELLLKAQQVIPNKPLGTFYHYASKQSLLGIIENQSMWFTDYRYLNDPNEGKVVSRVFNKVVKELKQSGLITDHQFELIRYAKPYNPDAPLFFLDYLGNRRNAVRSFYVASFSKKKDELALWSFYSQKSGCNICFTSSDFKRDHLEYIEIIYDEDKQKQIITDLVLSLLDNELDSNDEYVVLYALREQLTRLMLMFKSDEFSFEQEVRVVYSGDVERSDVKYRIRDEFIIPYISIPLNKMRFDVLCSPLNKDKRIMDGITHLIQTRGFDGSAKESKIKLRY